MLTDRWNTYDRNEFLDHGLKIKQMMTTREGHNKNEIAHVESSCNKLGSKSTYNKEEKKLI